MNLSTRSFGANPVRQSLWLGLVLTQRDLSQRYKGTVLGALWPFVYSGLLLAMFTFVFSLVLKVRWSLDADGRPHEGALMIFAGLVPYLFVAEVLTRSASCITSVPNYVKKIRFPLALLPGVVVASATMLSVVNTLILVVAIAVLWHEVPRTALMLPCLLPPLVLFGLGIAFLLGALGVFFRDLSQLSPLLAQLAMFLAPVCYPATAVPKAFAVALDLNPLTWFVTEYRHFALDGQFISIEDWIIRTLTYGLFALGSFAFFQRTRKSFADLL